MRSYDSRLQRIIGAFSPAGKSGINRKRAALNDGVSPGTPDSSDLVQTSQTDRENGANPAHSAFIVPPCF